AGTIAGVQVGQRLFGGDGSDQLFAYAPDTSTAPTLAGAAASGLLGDQLFGEAGPDWLYGNLPSEVLSGGPGKDNLYGDWLAGPLYALNPNAAVIGSADRLFGNEGEDQLFGGGGDDELWGGADSDWLEGQVGSDTDLGGEGVDILVLDTSFPGGSQD